MQETLHVFRKILRNGVEIKIKRKKYRVTYDRTIWDKFPKSLHRVFADSLAYITTWHLPMAKDVKVVYHFTSPPIGSVFFKILLYSIPMTVFEQKEKNLLTSDLLKKFYNVNFQTEFKGLNYPYSGKKVKRMLKEKAILLFSFGKDSLLTYGLLDELGVDVMPIFMREPHSSFENAHKRKLAERFYKTLDEEVTIFPLTIGRLRQAEGLFWGWDNILSQYAFILIPYYFAHKIKYLFFGNEQSCNYFTADGENYLINPVFEQSVSGMQLLQDVPKLFFIQTHIGSLIEPLQELFIVYMLHNRYPDVGRFQMSCFSETDEAKRRRWCGCCEKCARLYIMFKALGISPERVGFYGNEMLTFTKEKYYVIFDNGGIESAYGGSGLGKDEQLLAFYLAYRNGVKGELIEKFKKLYLEDVEKRKEKLVENYFGLHTSLSLPSDLRKKAIKIFEKEREKALAYVRKLL